MRLQKFFTTVAAMTIAPMVLVAGTYTIDWSTMDGGGGRVASEDGKFIIDGTIGQPDAGGVLQAGDYKLEGGFWQKLGDVIQTGRGVPELKIRQTGKDSVELYWNATTGKPAGLQSSAELAEDSWTNLKVEVTADEEGNSVVAIEGITSMRYYRLQTLKQVIDLEG